MNTESDGQDAFEESSSRYDEYKEKRELLKEVEELRKYHFFLTEEKMRIKRECDILEGELEGLKIAISSSEEYKDSYDKRKKNCISNIKTLKNKKLQIVNDINDLHSKLKDAKSEDQSVSKLHANLKVELNDIMNEKSIVMKRLNVVRSGVDGLLSDRDERIPGLVGCDSVLKQVHGLLRESKDRMEVSALLKKGVK